MTHPDDHAERLNDSAEDAALRVAAIFGWPAVVVAMSESPTMSRLFQQFVQVSDAGGEDELEAIMPADAHEALKAMEIQFAGLSAPLHK